MGKTYLFLAMLLLFATISSATQLSVEMMIGKDDAVTQTIFLRLYSTKEADKVEFRTPQRPLSVNYSGNSSVIGKEDGYVVVLGKDLKRGLNFINATLRYDTLVERGFSRRVFRTAFEPQGDGMDITLTLPSRSTLSEQAPSVAPRPERITSEGANVRISWLIPGNESADIIVLYEHPPERRWIAWSAGGFLLLGLGAFGFFRTKAKQGIHETLSSEEQKIIDAVRSGLSKQKEIAEHLEFSKSKMSKVTRRLEEKGLIERQPHFRTNLLGLTGKIK